jgi:uncharacterized membrane protein
MSTDVRETLNEARGKAQETMRDVQSRDEVRMAQQRAAQMMSTGERMPDTLYLAAGLGSMALSALFLLTKKPHMALFFGMWPSTIVSLAMLMKQRHPSREMQNMAGRFGMGAGGGELMAE